MHIRDIRTQYGDLLCNVLNQPECRKIRTRKTPNSSIFQAVLFAEYWPLKVYRILLPLSSKQPSTTKGQSWRNVYINSHVYNLQVWTFLFSLLLMFLLKPYLLTHLMLLLIRMFILIVLFCKSTNMFMILMVLTSMFMILRACLWS